MKHQLLLTEPEAAERLRLCPRTLRKARAAGTLRYVLIGRAVRYTIADLESYIEALRQHPAPCPAQTSTRTPTDIHPADCDCWACLDAGRRAEPDGSARILGAIIAITMLLSGAAIGAAIGALRKWLAS